MYKQIVDFIKKIYGQNGLIALHEPSFIGNEKKYVMKTIESTFVSSVGEYVNKFEEMVRDFVGAKYAVATVNGTAALHIALLLAGVKADDEVLTQPITFVATVNAITYCNAKPVFIDNERESLGISPAKLEDFLNKNTVIKKDGYCYNRKTKKRIATCVPMHTYGQPSKIKEINEICRKFNIPLVEDAAESLGSKYENKHTGTFGIMGILSFNGNKVITTGAGGMIITDDEALAKKAKHITTTAKLTHPWKFVHDQVGYNYRLANINAALGCAQMEVLPKLIDEKRKLAKIYQDFFAKIGIEFFTERQNCYSNYWLNTIILKDRKERDAFLEYTNKNGVMTRPAWQPMNRLKMYRCCQAFGLEETKWLEERLVNIPSKPLLKGK